MTNDRFKFRVWDKSLNKYMEFKEFKFMDVEFTFNPNTKEAEIEYDRYRYEVEQCTGLKDKNGKEIYEGDILGYFNNKIAVVWNNEYPSFELIGLDDTRYGKLSKEYVDSFGFGIIGNIHENRELLND